MRDLSEEEARRLWHRENAVLRQMLDHEVDDCVSRNLMRRVLLGLQDKEILDELVQRLTEQP